MPRLDSHSRQLLFAARLCVERAREDAEKRGELTTDSIMAIVMAAAATEAFINEFPENALAGRKFEVGEEDYLLPPIVGCAEALLEMEDSRAPVTSKYLIGSLALCGRSFGTGAPPFQDFKTLVDLRNAIMHVKPSWSHEAHAGRRLADSLAQRGLAIVGKEEGSLPWLDRLMTPAVALWAHDSALAMIRGFYDLVPVREHYDPLGFYRNIWRDYPEIPPPKRV